MEYRVSPACLALFVGVVSLSFTSAWGDSRRGREAASVSLHPENVRVDRPGTVRFKLDPRGARALESRRPTVVREFPLPDRLPVDLELQPFEVLTPDARMVVVDDHGERELPRPRFQAYRGRVAGDPDSRVTLTVFEGRIAGSIATWDDRFVVRPASFDLSDSDAADTEVRRQADDPDAIGPSACGGDPLPPTLPSNVVFDALPRESTNESLSIGGDTLLLGQIAVDATYEWYAHFGSVPAAQNYILSLMSEVATIFENEVKVQLQVPYLRIFQSAAADPYTDGTLSTSVLLSEMRTEWNATMTGVSRTAAHLFSVRPSGGSGLAYVDVLCHNVAQPGFSADYGVSTISALGGSWEPLLVAHELGHNFSSHHTHCYTPPIDYCANEDGCYQGGTIDSPSTIMSYCSARSATFHARVKDEQIRPAAEAAFPTCIETAGLPGSLSAEAELQLAKPGQCPSESLSADDGFLNSYFGYTGTAQALWVKRFTPGCYPFRLDQVDVQVGHASSVSVGRSVRLVVYSDPSGSGDPSNATLVHSEDVTLDQVSNSVFNQYALSAPVMIDAGDYYLGLYDLVSDAATNYIINVDTSQSGDSYFTANSTDPGSLQPYVSGTFMIRGHGGAVGDSALSIGWDAPCNAISTPLQDFAVYTGAIGDYANYSPLTCSSDRSLSVLLEDLPKDSFVIVVPRTSANEGSYGTNSAGVDRPPPAAACAPQSIGACE
jgi:hypothetical protein